MSTAYIVEQGTKVRKSGHRLLVEKDGAPVAELKLKDLEGLAVFGHVQLTTQALAELLAAGVPCSLLSVRGEYRGRLVGRADRNVPLRIAQFSTWREPRRRLDLARRLVAAKVANALAVLDRQARSHPDLDLAEARATLRSADGRLAAAPDLDALRGVEGWLTRAYFSGLSRCVRGELTFAHRTTRPPADPFNALLSFGYVLVGNEITGLLYAHGFDPYIGIYHDVDYGRPSLALDVLEVFRHALVDRFVLFLSNNRVFTPGDFETRDDGGVYLRPPALKVFLRHYERRMGRPAAAEDGDAEPNWRAAFARQIDDLAAALKSGGDLATFRVPG